MSMLKYYVICLLCFTIFSCKSSESVLYQGINYQIKWFLDADYIDRMVKNLPKEEIHLNSALVDSTMPNPFSPIPWFYFEVQPEDSINIFFRDSINWRGAAVVSNINSNGYVHIKHKDVISSIKVTSSVIDYIIVTYNKISKTVTEVRQGTINARAVTE